MITETMPIDYPLKQINDIFAENSTIEFDTTHWMSYPTVRLMKVILEQLSIEY